ncbi:unnamed protein product, partial [Hapterophycus canaliculatus]
MTTKTLVVTSGFWRASLDSIVIRQCLNEDACQGGSSVATVQEYCNEGYEGPQCAVCAPGYGGGVGNTCHVCSARFKNGMYALCAVSLLLTAVVAAFLAVYLVGGRDAVSTTITRTKQSFRLDRSRSVHGGRSNRIWLYGSGSSDWSPYGSRGGGGGGSTGSLRRERSARGRTNSAEIVPSSSYSTARNSGFSSSGGAVGAASRPGAAAPDDRVGGDGGSGGGSATALVEGPPPPPPSLAGISGRAAAGTAAAATRAAVSSPSAAGAAGRESKEEKKKKTTAARISKLISALPLSKLKIVIAVVWQILGSFSEITQVPFPPVYEKFLTTIGVFSFDLGWILSASCLATRIGFYDKLLMVTIAPVVLLCLLGVTFYIGSKRVYARRLKGARSSVGDSDHDDDDASDMKGSSSADRPSTTTDRTRGALATGTTPTANTAVARRAVHSTLRRQQSSIRRVIEAGAGDEADVEQQNRLWQLFARHTTMTLIILYLVYTQVSTVV